MISKYCRDRNIVGNSRNFAARVLEADEAVTPDLCKKFFFSMGKYIEAYKGGASGNDVLKKVKELKRHRHRSAPVQNSGEERRGKYDRKRGENALNYFHQQENASPSQSEDEDGEEYSEGGEGGEGGSHGEEEDTEGGEQGSYEEDIEPNNEELKGALWNLVVNFLSMTTGQSPFEKKQFHFPDFMMWFWKTKKEAEEVTEDHMRRLFSVCDLFSSNGNEINIIKSVSREAEEAFNCYIDRAEAEKDAAEKLEYAEEAIWLTVKTFIRETTGQKPFECQHFFLSDLQNWFTEKGHSQSGRLLVNLQQHIDRFERFSREDDNCWIENYNSSQDDSDEND